MFDKQWIYNKAKHNEYLEYKKSGEAGTPCGAPSFVEEIYYRRGIDMRKSCEIEELSDPYMLPDMDKAVERILSACEDGGRIAVFGDYDADGVTACAVLYHFLKYMLDADVTFYIPDRIAEGYGMSCSAIDRLAEQSVSLIVTVDNGIAAQKEIEYALSMGIDVVVTDHHRCPEILPSCAAVVDPCILQKETPASGLCGAGVAFALISALADQLGMYNEIRKYIPIVMIGTLGDAVPLVGDNRILVKYGLRHLYDSGWKGLELLLTGIGGGRYGKDTEINSTYITFYVVPKLNAAGRLGNAARAFELLITQDEQRAAALAEELINENTKRQAAESDIAERAMQQESRLTADSDSVIIAVGEGWHHGVIGIVASRLAEKYKKPSFVLVREEQGLVRGSARSVKGFDIYKALSGCQTLMERFGGHEMAAGLTIKEENIPALIRHLNEFALENAQYMSEPPNVEIDAVITPEDITAETCEAMARLEPHGKGNTQPVLCVRGLRVDSCSKVGDGGKHLKILFSADLSNGKHITVSGVAFSQGAYEQTVRSIDGLCSVICKAEINTWQGRETISLIISDISDCDYNIDNAHECVYNSDYVTTGGFTLERSMLAVMYKQLLSFGDAFRFGDLYRVRANMRKAGVMCTWYIIRSGLDVFAELGLIQRIDKQNYKILKPAGRTELTLSETYRKAQVIR